MARGTGPCPRVDCLPGTVFLQDGQRHRPQGNARCCAQALAGLTITLLSLALLAATAWLCPTPAQAQLRQKPNPPPRPSFTRPTASSSSADDSDKTRPTLKTESGEDATIHWHERTRVPRQIKGHQLHRQVPDSESEENRDHLTARALLRKQHDLLRLRDPDHELKLERQTQDEKGRRYLRFSQLHREIPVWPSDVIVELDRYGDVDLVSSAHLPTPTDVITTPVVTWQRAIELARGAVRDGQRGRVSAPELIIYSPRDRLPRLAWKLELVVSPAARWLVLIDALTETTLDVMNQIKHGTSVTGAGTDLQGVQNRPLHVWSSGGSFYMVDASKAMFVSASDPPTKATTQGGLVVLDAATTPNPQNQTLTLSQVSSNNSTPFGGIPDVVSASYGLSETYDYFLQRHGRNSIDGQGGTVTAVVRLGDAFDNAFWDGQAASMYFGGAVYDYAAALDIVGHEWTHGIIETTANLFYTGQSASLTEAFADIFGEMVEARTKGTAPDWLKMITHYAPPQTSKTIHNFANPGAVNCPNLPGQPACPSKLTQYATTAPQGTPDAERESFLAHTNSSIIVHAYYQLAKNLPGAIGLQDAERIFFCALTTKLGAQAQFIDARLGAVACAEQLFGINSPQAQRVGEAFDVVEIFDAPPTQPFPPLAAVNSPDSTLFWDVDGTSFLGRVESALGDPITGKQIFSGSFAGSLSVTGDGSKAVFIHGADICLHDTNVNSSQPCNEINVGPGVIVSSAAISRDGLRIAYVPMVSGQPSKQIRVASLNLSNPLNPSATVLQTYTVQAPVTEGTTSITVQSVGALTFTTNGNQVVFEAFNTITFESGSAQGLWSIYALELGTGQVIGLVPPTPGLDQRFPAMSRTSDQFVTFETAAPNTNMASLRALDRSTGSLATLLSGIQESSSVRVRPGYTGNDAAIVYATTTSNGNTRCLRQPLIDHVTPAGPTELWLDDAFACVVYRRGPFSGIVGANLTVTKAGDGGGLVISSPTGIICGGDCGEFYPTNTTVSLIATPDAQSHFAGWSGPLDCEDGVVTVSMAITCTATFDKPALPATSTLTVSKGASGNASLRVYSQPEGIDCGPVCTANFKYGSTVTLMVEQPPVFAGSNAILPIFSGWNVSGQSQACPGTGSCTVTLNAASQQVATNFNISNVQQLTVSITQGNGTITSYPPSIICSNPPPAVGTNLCQAKFGGGGTVYLSPTAAPGYTFSGWSGACTGTGNCAIVMNASKLVSANFVTATTSLPGDDRFTPIVIPNEHFIDRRQITGYTTQAGDPPHSCGSGEFGSVWYQFTPRQSGRAIISTVPSEIDTIVSVYLASTNLSEVGCNDNDTSPFSPPPNFPSDSRLVVSTLSAGATYLIKVSSRPVPPFASPALTFSFDLLPGDHADEPIVITNTPFRDTRSIALYDFSPFEPGPPESSLGSCAPAVGNSIYYRFTPTTSGTAVIATKGSGYDTVLSVSEEVSTKEVTGGCNDDVSAVPPIDATSKVTVGMRANVAYLIRVASFGFPIDPVALRSSATVTLTLSYTPNLAAQYPLTVQKAGNGSGAVSGGGINCSNSQTVCTVQYASGTTVTLTANDASGSDFTGWRGGGCTGTGTCTVTMDMAQTVTATFLQTQVPANFNLAVSTTGQPAGPITISWPGQSNINCNAPCNQSIPTGKVVTVVVSLPQPPLGDIQFVAFAGWTGCDEVHGLECTITMTGNLSVTAALTRPHYLVVALRPGEPGRVTSSPAGIDCTSGLCGAAFPLFSQVALTALPTKSSSIVKNTGCNNSPDCTIGIGGKHSVMIGFEPAAVIVTIQRLPGTESIPPLTSNPPGFPGLNCGANGPFVCTSQFTAGDTLVFTPNDVVFRDRGMSCDPPGSGICTLTLELIGQGAPQAITLGKPSTQQISGGNMPMLPHTLEIRLPGSGNGSVLSEERFGIDCQNTLCTFAFNNGSMFSLVARASPGSNFAGWNGCDSVDANDGAICNVTMLSARTTTAIFSSPRTLTVFKSAAGGGAVSSNPSGITTCAPLTQGSQTPCEANFDGETTVTLTPQADNNSQFAGWTGCDVVQGADCQMAMSSNRTAIVNFALPTLTIDDVAVSEGNAGSTNATFTVTLSKAVGQQVTVKYSTADGTATSGSDYTAISSANPPTLTFSAGDTQKQFNVTVQGGTSNEPDETFFVNLSAPTNATLGTKSQGMGSILNDDGPGTLQISAPAYTVGEGGGTATITVRRTHGNVGAVGATVGTSNGTATAGSDYTALTSQTGAVSFANGDRADKTVTIPILEDSQYEGDEIIPLTLSNPTGPPGGVPTLGLSNATLTITDNELPVVTIQAVSPATIAENSGSPGQFTVSRSAAASTPLTVSFSVAGTATPGIDYLPVGQSVVIPPGLASSGPALSVQPNDDLEIEADETVIVTLTSDGSYTIGSPGSATVTITSDDRHLTINDVTVTEGNTGTVNATFTVTLTPAPPSGQQVTVQYATANGPSPTATAPGDYTATSGSLTFLAGQTEKTVTVPVQGDTLDEPDESFLVILTNPTNATIVDQQGVGTIIDDDGAPSLTINDVTVPEGNSGTANAIFTVTLAPASGQTVTVQYATANGPSPTATTPADYTATSGSLTFDPGQTSKTVTVAVQGDTLDEPNETFVVDLSNPTNATIADSQGVGTISDDDVAPNLTINDVTVTEGNAGTANATFTVTLSSVSGQTVTVHYATADGSAPAATGGTDYVAVGDTTLTFNPGETTKQVIIQVNGDTVNEANEKFVVNLSNATNATIADNQGQGTITDDDGAPSLSINDVTVTEGNAGTVNAAFTVTLSPASGQTVTVHYATANNTATAGSDYVGISDTTLTFTPGVTSQPVTVTVNGDTLDEANETFVVNLSNASNATIIDNQGQGTITDDDGAPSLSINDVTVTEGNAGTVNATFTVSLSAASGQTVTVQYTTANNTATAGNDYTAPALTTLTFNPGETSMPVTVQVSGDALDEPNETFFVNLSNPTNATISDGQGVGTITDDDPAPSLSINDVAVTEGNAGTVNATFTVTLSAASGQTVTVHYATANSTATAGSDYVGIADTMLTFTPGITGQQVTVTVNGDTLDEANETFVVNLSNSTNATISDGQGVGTINDDDPAPSLSINDVTVTEGNAGTVNATFTVTLSPASGQTLMVHYSTADGSAPAATGGTDYVMVADTTLTFNPGETTKQVTVTVNGDTLDEANETFVVNLFTPTNATISDNQGVGTIIDDDETLSLTKGGTGIGSVSATSGVITCGPGCTSTSVVLPTGTQVTLTAAPAAGSALLDWGGACDSIPATSLTCTVTLTTAKSVTANFRALPIKRPPPVRTPPPTRQ